jgi:FkbM family methyltransferase
VQHRTSSPSPHQPILLQPVFGSRLYPAYADSIIAKHLMYRSEWFDWDMLHFLQAYLQPGDHFLDIGANTGLHTLLASTRIDPTAGGRLTCLEPHPLNVRRLGHTLKINALDHATVHPIAASDTNGTLYLTGSDVFAHLSHSTTAAIPVATARLDDLLPDTPIHACKIDVEGAEWQVLRGATRLIESGHLPLLILEWRGHLENFGETAPDFTAWLQSQNYRLAAYDHATQTLRFSPPYPEDIFAITPAGLALIQTRLPHLRLR